ncbi:putative bifunctional diguanylate cyclase/phosphodiesterase [Cryptosporangium phraense]|uniref:Bifunctional diguanylate cyclase/phosphodiesterase n=1 Tax=Cryptosporangium phraense TaxID=2593070 RepID=A0A545AHW7_9ACTN|nr:bifunctional diguanylate cyclase/phosphodiesterase [Cryptosporangium phraense]TQS40917.1 bifunctional diguanylate cyclase/phosphodiesterase [Cryptosporangium phraense]
MPLRWFLALRGPAGWWQAPVVATPRLMSIVAGSSYVTAGLVAVIVAVLGEDLADAIGECALGIASATAGAIVLLTGRRWPRWAFHLVISTAVAFITLVVWLSQDEGHALAYATIYPLASLFTMFFFSWAVGLIYQVAIAISLVGGELAWTGLPRDVVLPLLATNAVVAVIIGWLVREATEAEADTLTGLPNRRGLQRAVDQALDAARRDATPVTVAFLDLDSFRRVNELLGTAQADRLLRLTGQAWRHVLPADALLARSGGDEFGVVLPGVAAAEGAVIIDGLRALLPEDRTCSAGVAEWRAGDSASVLLGRADAALQQAKLSGRSRTFVDVHSGAQSREMVDALPAGEFLVVYQPIVDLASGVVVGAEALVRWTHPERGTIPPIEFIPLAEESGFILDLGRWVLRAACEEAATWDWAENPRISVNVSGRQLHDLEFVPDVRRILADTGLPPRRLVLEVTESMLEADAPVALAALEALRADGVRIAVDDFGTGYSSLSRLDRLPVDILKIDRAFVNALRPDTAVAPVITAIVALAQALGMSTVAEGIEEPYQAAALIAHGCSAGQGWLYGRPGPAAELARLAEAPPPPPLAACPALAEPARLATSRF